MRLPMIGAIVVSLLAVGAALAQTTHQDGEWHGLMEAWPTGHEWHGDGPMPRHHVATTWGIPQPYNTMTNPLPRTQGTLDMGAKVYTDNCEECHGKRGLGDGDEGSDLSPPPGNLTWLSNVPMSQRDAFMYWAIAQGGFQFGTGMPAFNDALSKQEIWAEIAYIQAHLPQQTE